MKTAKTKKPFACLECGHRMSLSAAEKAADRGCPGCGGVDIDLTGPTPREALTATAVRYAGL